MLNPWKSAKGADLVAESDQPGAVHDGVNCLKEKIILLFHITQTHSPESCPKDEGGSKTLYDPNVVGLKLLAMFGAFAEHEIYYLVEAENMEAIQKFLHPGFKRCTCRITPVLEEAIER
jgi:hypothetical protein